MNVRDGEWVGGRVGEWVSLSPLTLTLTPSPPHSHPSRTQTHTLTYTQTHLDLVGGWGDGDVSHKLLEVLHRVVADLGGGVSE